MKKLPLHWQIITGMALGVLFGLLMSSFGWGAPFFPAEKLAIGLALIFAIDRPLDMCRTVVNVTGDAMVSVVVARTLGKLNHVPSSIHHKI